jgi:hypothetical protein
MSQMSPAQRAAVEAALPYMPRRLMLRIPIRGLAWAGADRRSANYIIRRSETAQLCCAPARQLLWDYNTVNVIGHEPVADERKPVQSTKVPQQVEVDQAFSIRRENELPRVAKLCHMVRGVQSDDACESSHEQKVPQSHETGDVPSVPGFRSHTSLTGNASKGAEIISSRSSPSPAPPADPKVRRVPLPVVIELG